MSSLNMATNVNTREKFASNDMDQMIKDRLESYKGLSSRLAEKRSDPFESTNKPLEASDKIVTRAHIPSESSNVSKYRGNSFLRSNRDLDSETSLTGRQDKEEAKLDPHNDMDKYLKPSEYLKYNVLPRMEEIYMIDYNLSLDIRNDGISNENHTPDYCFQFAKFGNINRVDLVSIIVSSHHSLINEPYLFVNFKELSGRCHLSNGTRTFGKVLFMANREGNLIYVPEDCFQVFSRPICLDSLTLNFCDSSGIPINIKEIKIARVLKSKSKGELTIECQQPHFLKVGEKIEVQINVALEIESYDVEVSEIVDDKVFKIKDKFDNITAQMKIFKTKIDLSFTLKFSEVNWFILNDNNVATSNIIRLSELVRSKNKSVDIDTV